MACTCWIELIGSRECGLAGSGRGAANVDRGGGARASQDNGATGRPRLQRVMTDLDAGDGGQPASGHHGASRPGAGPGGRNGSADDDAGARC